MRNKDFEIIEKEKTYTTKEILDIIKVTSYPLIEYWECSNCLTLNQLLTTSCKICKTFKK